MVLSRYRIALLAASIFAVAVRAAEQVVAEIEGFVDRCITVLLSMFPAMKLRLVDDGPDMILREDRASLASSLLESLRHEKGVPRYGAARGC